MTSDIKSIQSWKSDNKPLIIAGPCSVESHSQVMETAKELAKINIDIFRAGIWKPRTRPDSFEGIGYMGLQWLEDVKAETNLAVAIEVASSKHVEHALKHNIDVLWIGARTSANPFAVQEIAESLKGVKIPILIKNPINPDIELWLGAIERISNAGITKIAAIHRGFSAYNSNNYRNNPQWQIPIELKRRLPNIPLISDPSHLGGKRDFLHEISQKALDLNYDGLMIESHINPSVALSDAEQQITPNDLSILLSKLIVKNETINNADKNHLLNNLRNQIDECDDEIFSVLSKRMKISDEIGVFKNNKNISILQNERWDKVINKTINNNGDTGLSREFIMRILYAIHQESINHQSQFK